MFKYNEMTKIKTPCVDYTGSKQGRLDNGYEITVGFTNYKIVCRRQWSALHIGSLRRYGSMHYNVLVNNEILSNNYMHYKGNTFSKDSALVKVNKLIEGRA